MSKQTVALIVLSAGLLTVPAAAQTGSGAGSQPPAMSQGGTSGQATQSANQPSSGSQAQSGQFIQQSSMGEWRASKLVGVDVYGQNNEKIGDIKEVMIDQNGNAHAIIIGVGGFLGIGEKNVAVPFKSVQWSNEPRRAASAGTNTGAGGSAPNTTGTAGTASSGTNSANRDYPDYAMLNMSRDDLKNAPEFHYASDNRSGSSGAATGTRPAGGTGTTR